MSKRIEAIDSLRGFAILGILLLNIFSFALFSEAGMKPFYKDSVPFSDVAIWSVLNIFAEGKFRFILALLFGASLELLRQHGRDGNISRLLVLAVIGLLHGVLLWEGDILLSYGIAGLLAWYFINTRQKLFGKAVILYLFGVVMLYLLLLSLFLIGEGNAMFQAQTAPEEIFYESYWKTYGGLWAIEHRINEIGGVMVMVIVQYGWQIAGTMLCGAMLMRNGWLKGEFSRRHYRRLALCLIPAGMAIQCIALSIRYLDHDNYSVLPTIFNTIPELAIPLFGLGYIALIYGFWSAISCWRITFWLRQVGRMALSSYLLQTLICTTIFYRFGLFEQFSRLELMVFIPFIWALSIWFACWWLKRYSQGPMEKLWRSLTAKLAGLAGKVIGSKS
ncbi:DUF418 domain-containing protein YeiB [Xenorhabdus sp. XENO-10]|uniref:DUF418 domain-containing protein YeiB n=1 Tax=Xenorhabdus yunnanensis TaxID=3025878 RepID=A0ABT5LEW6_9GAMM|nr:DUF418 domain-containing protein YeiB [Xenorhabdus yunnanensis]MDC9589018.1 DUF418 domain-containing protein YeiB [Xenorhabdus yunnanensis]